MSYSFQAFLAIALPHAEAEAAAMRVAEALRSAGVLGKPLECEADMPGIVSKRFETADEIEALFDATPEFVGGVGGQIEISSGRYVNGWAFNQISEARCPACSSLFKWDDAPVGREAFEAVLAAMVDAVGPYLDDGELGWVRCSACGVASRADGWSCDVAPGFSVLGVEFHHLPPLSSQAIDVSGWSFANGVWRIDVPRIVSDAAGCRFGATWGRI